MNSEFLLKAYGLPYGPEEGPWTLSAANKYLEFRKTEFFEEHFKVHADDQICNIGIGEGTWDRYLSYQLGEGSLTSADGDGMACIQLVQCLENEGNPAQVRALHRGIMEIRGLEERFSLVTLTAHTGADGCSAGESLRRAAALVKPGGSLYFVTVDPEADPQVLRSVCADCGMKEEASLSEQKYQLSVQYWKFRK